MRKTSGILLAVAMALPIGLVGIAPAGAVGGTVCAKAAGSAKFTPALPKLGSTTKVIGTFTATGTVSGCVGGGVTGGKTKTVSIKSKTGSNCATLAKPSTPTKATETITWNTGKTSTVAISLSPIKGKPTTNQQVTGTVTAGMFKGSHQTVSILYKLAAGECVKTGLSTVTYTSTSKSVIK